MRLLIVSLLAGVSVCAAAESPTDSRAAASPDTASAVVAADSTASADPAEAAEPAEGRDESATSEASEASAAETAPVDPAEAARLEAEKEKAQDREFAKHGFKPTQVKGKKKYCELYHNAGSRLGKEMQCFSAEQVRAKIDARAAAEAP